MSISRLTSDISLDRIEKFIIMYGNTNDQYCDEDLITGNIDFMLWRYFRQHEYQRIIFVQSTKEVYFLDKESMQLCLPHESSYINQKVLTKGPLGNLELLDKKTSNISFEKKALNFTGLLSIFGKLMLEDISTIIIFNNSQELNKNNLGEDFYILKNKLLNWSLKNVRSVNKCLFTFNSPNPDTLNDTIKNNGLDFLNSFLLLQEKKDDKNIIQIGFPDKVEINNLIHHFRLLKRIRVEWDLLPKIIEFLTTQETDLKLWYSLFKSLPEGTELNKKVLSKWYDEGLLSRSSRFIIQNLDNKYFFSVLFQDFSLIYCQDDSTVKIVKALESWYFRKNIKPFYCFFAGPESSGKSYTVNIMAKALIKVGYRFLKYNCIEINSETSLTELDTVILSEEKVIVLFEDIDKAEESLINYITNLSEKTVSSRKDIFCFTLEIKSSDISSIKKFNDKAYINEEPDFQSSIRDYMAKNNLSEKLIRLSNLFLIYNPLSESAIMTIIKEEIDEIAIEYDLIIHSIDNNALKFLYDKTMGNLYRTKTFTNYLENILGNAFFDFRKTYPSYKKLFLKLSNGEIEILPFFSDYNKIDSRNKIDDAFNYY